MGKLQTKLMIRHLQVNPPVLDHQPTTVRTGQVAITNALHHLHSVLAPRVGVWTEENQATVPGPQWTTVRREKVRAVYIISHSLIVKTLMKIYLCYYNCQMYILFKFLSHCILPLKSPFEFST